jgi:beta-mannosidase
MREIIELNGEWELHPVSEFSNLWISGEAPAEGWLTQEIPAHWQEHPDLKEHSGKMIYRKTFSLDPLPDHIYRLQTGGVFYRFRAYLNRFALGGAEGYFLRGDFDLTPYLRGENTLVLEVDSPGDEDKTLLTGLFAGYPGIPGVYNPGGLWQPVRILRSGPAYLRDWRLRTESVSVKKEKAGFFLAAEIFSLRDAEVELVLTLTPHNFSGTPLERRFAFSLHRGNNHFTEGFSLDGVKPWWTWDLGEPALYRLDIRLQSGGTLWDEDTEIFGVRHFLMEKFLATLNGEKIFLKGCNYLPPAIYPARVGIERYREDFTRLKEGNQNMIRCYRHVAAPDFYRAAAEAGVLVWQDFPLNPDYPAEQAARALTQAGEFARFLGRHPAVVVSSILNISGYEEGRVKPGSRLRLLADKLARRLAEEDPVRPVIAVSGERALFSPSDTGFGHGVVAEEGELYRFDRYRKGIMKKNTRFVSWFGAPSFSQADRIPAQGGTVDWEEVPPEIRNLLGWKEEKRTKDGTAGEGMDREGMAPEELVRASQERQGEILRFYIDRLRFQKYDPTGGMLFFCLRDLLPGPFWSLVDAAGKPKESFSVLSLCYRQIYVFALFAKAVYRQRDLLFVPVCLGNDRHQQEKLALKVKARLCDPRGRLVWKDQWSVEIGADEKTRVLGSISVLLMEKGIYTLELVWDDEEREGETVENIYHIKVL